MKVASKEHEMARISKWAYKRLQDYGKVGKEDFLTEFGKERRANDSALTSKWNRAVHAVCAVLSMDGKHVTTDGSSLEWKEHKQHNESSQLTPYTTVKFQPNRERSAKEKIGELIAGFLKHQLDGMTIFLGSGSTIFHVGLAMCEKKHAYNQRFVTVNIPLAHLWCARPEPPVRNISIPEAVLDTETFRFTNMPGPPWPLTVSIVGADGCVYDEEKKEVIFFGNEQSVATGTSQFVQYTKHSVIFCLTNTKLRTGFARAPNTGPPILPPKKGVIRILVTDEPYQKSIKPLEKDGWMIVTQQDDWGPVRKKMGEGEQAEIELD